MLQGALPTGISQPIQYSPAPWLSDQRYTLKRNLVAQFIIILPPFPYMMKCFQCIFISDGGNHLLIVFRSAAIPYGKAVRPSYSPGTHNHASLPNIRGGVHRRSPQQHPCFGHKGHTNRKYRSPKFSTSPLCHLHNSGKRENGIKRTIFLLGMLPIVFVSCPRRLISSIRYRPFSYPPY